jgi:membrane protease YdiL (CAAX protease family)
MLTFSIGVLTQQWNLAVVGIVYSFMTAAAMWENFRARLPYLYDPWSEKLPPPPTLMHAMIAISILVEGGALFTGIVSIFTGRQNLAVAQAVGYAICALFVSIGVSTFLRNRNVSLRDVWRWPLVEHRRQIGALVGEVGFLTSSFPLMLLAGAVGGVLLGLFAHGYLAALLHFPTVAELIRQSQEQMAKIPGLRTWYTFMAVLIAPFTEEYLFRGLLFRALDREWGGWRAVVGSAAFFAIYHPPLSWLPVALLGMANALLFKQTGRLEPCVILHMVYNAVVLTQPTSPFECLYRKVL